MSVDEEIIQEEARDRIEINAHSYNTAPKVYSHQEAMLQSNKDIQLLFGTVSPLSGEGKEFLVHTVCFMTEANFRGYVDMLNKQVSLMDQEADK